MIFTVQERDVKDQLVRKGFEVVGEIGDDINVKKTFTMHGDEKFISKRERDYITIPKFTRGKSKLLYRKNPQF